MRRLLSLLVLPLLALACSAPEPWENQVAEVSRGTAKPMPLQRQATIGIDAAFSDAAHEEILTACAELNTAFPALQIACQDHGGWRFVATSLPGAVGGQSYTEGDVILVDEGKIRKFSEDMGYFRYAVMHEIVHELGFSDHIGDPKSLMYEQLSPVLCVDQATVNAVIAVRPDLAPGAKATCPE
jgi:hypothetical protein